MNLQFIKNKCNKDVYRMDDRCHVLMRVSRLQRSAIIFLFCVFISMNIFANEIKLDKSGIFSGRVSKINETASLVRVKIDFPNMKYLNKRDIVELWEQHNPVNRCKGYIAGKSNNYILLKITDYQFCKEFIFFSLGSYLQFYSQDLVNNLKMGKELIKILLKKRLVLSGKVKNFKKVLDTYIDRVSAVNKRYDILREKLELEWKKEVVALEEDQTVAVKRYNDLKMQLNELDDKMERYRIVDKNLTTDRWSLDTRLYYEK